MDIVGAPLSVGLGGPVLSALLAVERAADDIPRSVRCRHCGNRWTSPSVAAERRANEQELERRTEHLQRQAERLRRRLQDSGDDASQSG